MAAGPDRWVMIGRLGRPRALVGEIWFRSQHDGPSALRRGVEARVTPREGGERLLLVEAVPPEVAAFIRDELPIPVLGIGAGGQVDGQLLIVSDVLGTAGNTTIRAGLRGKSG